MAKILFGSKENEHKDLISLLEQEHSVIHAIDGQHFIADLSLNQPLKFGYDVVVYDMNFLYEGALVDRKIELFSDVIQKYLRASKTKVVVIANKEFILLDTVIREQGFNILQSPYDTVAAYQELRRYL